MSPVGHTIVGLAFASIALPNIHGFRSKATAAFLFVAIANLPDWPLPNWGHDRYDISHSVFVNCALIFFLGIVLRKLVKAKTGILAAGTWLSHLLLDSFYNHGNGVAIYWPFSSGRLNFAMPWFNNLDLSQSPVSNHNINVYFVEFAAYTPIL